MDQFVVNMNTRECTYRKWEITGIPCKHAICALWDMAAHGENIGTPEDMVHPCYNMEVWRRVYSHTVDPINGPDMWHVSDCPTILTHPKHHKQIGRPKKKRRRGLDEAVTQCSQTNSNMTKLTRKFISVTCGKCKNKGHNSRTCKGQGGIETSASGAGATSGVGTGRGRGRPRGRGRGRGQGRQAGDGNGAANDAVGTDAVNCVRSGVGRQASMCVYATAASRGGGGSGGRGRGGGGRGGGGRGGRCRGRVGKGRGGASNAGKVLKEGGGGRGGERGSEFAAF